MIPLFGHDAAIADFRSALDSGRLHHAWLIIGPEGIGKATFARKAALRALAQSAEPNLAGEGLDIDPDHRQARLFAASSHPDFHLIEREVWDAKGIVPKADRSGTEPLARNIRIGQIRSLNAKLGMTTALSPARVVLIDSVDDLEPSAANALLKNLEEPPADTLFLLVSHAPAALLPTIRSRCRMLRLSPLADDAMAAALHAPMPDADQTEIAALVAVGEGAPGRAVAFRGLDIAALDRDMAELVSRGDPTNARRAELAQSLGGRTAQPRYEAFLSRVPSVIAAAAKQRRGSELAEAVALWDRAAELATSARRLSLDPQATVFELAGLLAALAPATSSRAR